MREIKGNIWNFQDQGWLVITTNAEIKKNGEAIMGKGIALEAKTKFPDLPLKLAKHIQNNGNILQIWPEYGLITYPTKYFWGDQSDLILIKKSAEALLKIPGIIYLPKVGCGCGGLDWDKEVKPILSSILQEDRFILISKGNH